MQIDFGAAFDRVNHQGILYRLCSVGIGGSVFSILTQCLSNRSHHVMVDGCRSKLVDVVSGVPQGFWAHYYSSCTLRSFFPLWKIKPIGYVDGSTLMAVVPKVYISTGIPTRVVGTCFCGEAREADNNLPI